MTNKYNSKTNIIKYLSILLIFLFFSGLLSLLIGQAITYDFLNYHFYAPYAALNGRIGIDFMPADIQSYFNPCLDFPFYFLVKYFNDFPKLILFLNGFWVGLFLFIFYLICDFLLKRKGLEKNILLIFCISVSLFSPILLNEFSPLSNDIQVAIGVLASILLLFHQLFKPFSKKRNLYIILAGLILGLTTGLKLIAAMYCFSFLITLICLYKKIDSPFKTIFAFCASIAIGFLITNGYWMYLIYSHFKNPFFPYFNNIFHSNYSDFSPILDSDFQTLRPKNFFEFLFFPFLDLDQKFMRGCERNFYDVRYAMSYLSIAALIFVYKTKRFENLIQKNYVLFLLFFIPTSYILGMLLFAQYRYFIPLNVFTPVLIIIAIYSVIKTKPLIYFLLTLIFLSLLSSTKFINGNVIRSRHPEKMLEVENMHIPDDSLVLLASRSIGFLIPFQNKNAKYIYFAFPKNMEIKNSYFEPQIYYRSDYIEKLLNKNINEHLENTYIIRKDAFAKYDNPLYKEALKIYTKGDFKGYSNCKEIKNNIYTLEIGKYEICKVNINQKGVK